MKIDIRNKQLAINGGKPVRKKNWFNNITTDKKELDIIKKVLKSGNLSLFEGSHKPEDPFSFDGGPYVKRLEKNWCNFYKIKNSISMNSATSCLFASIGALNIGYGDEVIVSPYTMTACALAPLIYGAIPIFADVEEETGCIDPKSFELKITKRTKAIIIVHQFGFPADMQKILKIAKKYKIKIIEDCAQAHGGKYKGKYLGTLGDIGVFSLNVNKAIQSGEGGICVTKSNEIAFRLRLIRNHGEAVVEKAKYKKITNIAGFNYRMTEITAAIAISQLKKLKNFNKKRLKLIRFFINNLPQIDFFKPLLGRSKNCSNCKCKVGYENKTGCKSTFYIFPFKFDKSKTNISRKKFIDLMNSEGAKFYGAYVKPTYYQPLYQKKELFKNGYPFNALENKKIQTNYYKNSCPVAERLYDNEIILNEHFRHPHNLNDIKDLIKIIKKIVKTN